MFSFIAVFPITIVIMNSLKNRVAIFKTPYQFPNTGSFSLIGFETVNKQGNFGLYYFNSITVTGISIFFIIFFGSMIAFVLAQYKFPGRQILRIFFLLGILIPIRLGSVSILNLCIMFKIVNTLLALILVYIAQGLPIAILILTMFMEQIPRDLIDAARLDGASEFRVYKTILPLIGPALWTVAAFAMLPIWNDLWFPLILAPGEKTRTVTLGALNFMGQFASDWNALLSALTISIIPVLIIYFLLARRIVGSVTIGSIK